MIAVVRRRRDEDLVACVRSLERTRATDNYPVHWPDDASRWLSPRGTVCAWVAEIDRTIVGHVVLHTVAAGHADWEAAGLRANELGAISRLFVDGGHRGAGIGGRLLEAAAREAVACGLQPVLEVVETRGHAIELYDRRGFRRVLTRPWSGDAALSHHFYIGPRAARYARSVVRIDYENVARDYDEARGLALEGMRDWRDAVAPYLTESAGPVLDIGAGTGQFAHAFAHWFDVPIVAIEPSAAMLEAARARRAHPRVTYVEGSAERLPVGDGAAGAAWMSTVIHHVSDLRSCASELRRALRPGAPVLVRSAFPGRLEAITLFRFFPSGRRVLDSYPTVEQAAAAFATAGFAIESLRSVPQVSAPSLGAFLAGARLRADTVLRSISDAEFASGLEAIERAIAAGEGGEPIVDRLDLLVLR